MTRDTEQEIGVPEAIGAALTGDAEMQTKREFMIAAYLIGIVVMVIVLVAVVTWLFGLAALNIVGLIATALIFFMLIAYAAGW
ncbi:hypothetical protein GI374_10495 [Paracoccus sp. S-4012]|uniref:hypothetical protein n=1 Tax=Paracoccus sp. S-4012 TaxID=2665648 RepID=UPI0012AF5CAF|nr:hypothetical protein [Paracoccus sp. S-4012]MRX50868.1 hypothetical protein [Paracoccus sp. S-4012]